MNSPISLLHSSIWLKNQFKTERLRIIFILVINFVGLALALIQPLPLKLLADSVFAEKVAFWPFESIENNTTLLVIASVGTLAIVIVTGLYSLFSGLYQQRVEMRLNLRIQQELLSAILRIPDRHTKRLGEGDYQYRLNSLAYAVADYLYSTLITIIRSCVFIVAMIGVVIWINPLLALITLLALPFLYLSVQKFGKKLEDLSEVITSQQSQVYDVAADTLAHNRLIQTSATETKQVGTFLNESKKSNALSVKFAITSTFFNVVNDSITSIATAVLILVGGLLVFDGSISFGDLLVFIAYMGMLYEPLQELSSAIGSYRQQKVQIRTLEEVIDAGSQLLQSSGTVQKVDDYSIDFSKVTLSYDKKLILDNISFSLQAGKKLAIIGASGSGKSSIIDLIPRLAIADHGFISVGNTEIKDWDVSALRRSIAIVDQSPQLINGTILQNIVYGLTSDTNNMLPEAIAAAQKANALNFIEALPDKFNTLIGSSGVELSGGQAQRLCLARAIIKKVPVLLLDEPTAALDRGSRKEVIKAIKNTMQDKTVIITTHDYELLQAVDVVIGIQDNCLMAINSTQELEAFITKLDELAQQEQQIGNLNIAGIVNSV